MLKILGTSGGGVASPGQQIEDGERGAEHFVKLCTRGIKGQEEASGCREMLAPRIEREGFESGSKKDGGKKQKQPR